MRTRSAAAALGLLVFAGVLASGEDQPARFTILQLNDVYKVEGLEHCQVGGLGRVRTIRKQLEAEGREVLVLHAGDAFFPSVMSKYLRSQPMIRCLNLLDGDADAFDQRFVMVPGNHEFDDKDPGLFLGRVAQSDFRYVATNTRYRQTKKGVGAPLSWRLKNVHETLVLDVGGVKVGLLGITCDAQRRDWIEFGYTPAAIDATVRSAIDSLKKEGARTIVAVTHQDFPEDARIAKAFPEIDLVIGGHEHFFMQKKVGNTWITKADSDARTVVVLDVTVPASGPIEVTPRKVALGPDVLPDDAVAAEASRSILELAKAVKDKTGRDLEQTVALTEHALEGVEPAVRGRETALGNFLCDVVRGRMETDVALVNGGAIRINDDVPAGTAMTVYDLEGVFFFDNDLVAFELTGAQLLDVLRNGVSRAHLGHGRFLQVSGVRFKYHVEGTADDPTFRIDASDVEVSVGGKLSALDLGRKYTVSTLDYVWEHGSRDGFALFAKGDGGTSPPLLERPRTGWRAATEDALRTLPGGRITTKIEGRITRVEK
jgi:5'-nucleotidase